MQTFRISMDEWQTLRDIIQNKDTRKGLEVANIEVKMKENRLRWFTHVQRHGTSKPIQKKESWSS